MTLHIAEKTVLEGLKDCARKSSASSSGYGRFVAERHSHGRDDVSVGVGPLVCEVATHLGRAQPEVRRRLLRLEALGLAMRDVWSARGTAHRWWPVGFAVELKAELEQVKLCES